MLRGMVIRKQTKVEKVFVLFFPSWGKQQGETIENYGEIILNRVV